MKAVTPPAGLQTGTTDVSVTGFGTAPAVGSGRLAARGERVDWPAVAGTPPGQPETRERVLWR